MNPYLDVNYQDRTMEIEELFEPTLRSIKRDPETYARLVNDLLFHWMHGTRETPLMIDAKQRTKAEST